uniref:Ribosomal protein S11 n=1 Tax=Tupiella akineta TaxID=160070 RepID=Q6UVU4_TUPAK|nr:ribosomal protein S11 [Tupiella akineta]AAQ18730.1 ribosomal protein S11 [Tupiella akineta]
MATQFKRNSVQKQHRTETYLFKRPVDSRKYSDHRGPVELKPTINRSIKALVPAPKSIAAAAKPDKKFKFRPSSLNTNRKQFKAGRVKNKSVEALPKNTNLFCLISINRTKNNTHAIISNLFGENKTKWSISAGQFKLPGGRRKTRLSQRMVYKSCLEKALSFGYKFTVIHCRGTRGSKVRIFRFFGDSLSVLLIKDTTGAAHNGCRPPKVRRV